MLNILALVNFELKEGQGFPYSRRFLSRIEDQLLFLECALLHITLRILYRCFGAVFETLEKKASHQENTVHKMLEECYRGHDHVLAPLSADRRADHGSQLA